MNKLLYIVMSSWNMFFLIFLLVGIIIGLFIYVKYFLQNEKRSKAQPIASFGSISNINELQKAEALFRALIENSHEAITLNDRNGVPIYQSPSLEKMIGWTLEERKLINFTEYIHPDDIDIIKSKIQEAIGNPGKPICGKHRIKHKDGHYILVEGSITNMLHDSNISAMVSNFRDITKQREFEEKIEFDRNNLSSLINNTNDLMWSVDNDLKLITSNNAFDTTVKKMSGNTMSKGAYILASGFSEEQLDRYKMLYKRALGGEVFTEIEYVDLPKDFWSEISFYPLRKGEDIIGTACFSRDVTELKKSVKETLDMVEILQKRNKDLNQFSYIVSHNLRSPIAKILGLSSLHKVDPEQNINGKNILECIEDEVMHLDNVVKDINNIISVRDLGNKQKDYITFETELQLIVQVLENQIKESNAQITRNFNNPKGIVTVKSYMYSIMLNLLSNAIKYRQAEVPLNIHLETNEDDKFVYLSVQDNGRGIDLEINKDKVFGLYKRFHGNEIEGRGIGLNLVKVQAESLGGSIEVESVVNQGTIFKVRIPKLNN
ncbi:MAG: PAS domain S-box protein [Bacteroidota bacterium]|nr:PAS domain S-box protein [Bacteroidota bacterium]